MNLIIQSQRSWKRWRVSALNMLAWHRELLKNKGDQRCMDLTCWSDFWCQSWNWPICVPIYVHHSPSWHHPREWIYKGHWQWSSKHVPAEWGNKSWSHEWVVRCNCVQCLASRQLHAITGWHILAWDRSFCLLQTLWARFWMCLLFRQSLSCKMRCLPVLVILTLISYLDAWTRIFKPVAMQ